MRTLMTASDIAAVERMQAFAKARGERLAQQASGYFDETANALRLFVCELALQPYIAFSQRFRGGNVQPLRELLTNSWNSVRTGSDIANVDQAATSIQQANFEDTDWDHPSASDAITTLYVFDACLGQENDKILGLARGIESLLERPIKKLIELRAKAGADLHDLASSIEAGAVTIPENGLLQEAIARRRSATEFSSYVDWLQQAAGYDQSA